MLRSAVEFVICLALTVSLARTWAIEGFQVPSGSMADGLLGRHRHVACADCGHAFDCDADLQPVAVRAVCPNCGFVENDLASLPDIEGDRLLVHKSAFLIREPRRWEPVVFRAPDQADILYIKRVVGLPSEAIEIVDGDVYIDGRIARKSLAEQRAMAVLVHDADQTPHRSTDWPPRWQGEDSHSRWQHEGERFVHAADTTHLASAGGAKTDWLTYRHWHRGPGENGQAIESPIRDDYGYNQSAPRLVEDSHDVTDVLLSCQLTVTGKGSVAFFATDGRDHFEARIDPATGAAQLLHNGDEIAKATLSIPLSGTSVDCELSLVDRQFVLALDGTPVFAPLAYEPADRPYNPTSRPLAIGAAGLELEISRLRVFRDVYYTDWRGIRPGWGQSEPYRLAADEYFVLGDNSPISQDSRAWATGPGVAENLLVGKPLCVHLPSHYVEIAGKRFQVPNLARLRAIR